VSAVLLYEESEPKPFRDEMNIAFIEALEEMAKEKGVPREDLYDAIRQGLAAAYREEHHTDVETEVEVEIDQHSGDISINGERIELAKFGRIATKKAEETIRQTITRKRRDIVYDLYINRVGEIISGSIHRFEGKDVWVNLGEAEAILPNSERIPGERYHAGDRLRAYLVSVERTQGDPRILLSRTHPEFVHQLLRLEVPEIEEGTLVVRRKRVHLSCVGLRVRLGAAARWQSSLLTRTSMPLGPVLERAVRACGS